MEVCEAKAALYGLQLAARYGYRLLHLEGDALSVITAVDKNVEGSSPVHLVYDQILSYSYSFTGFCLALLDVVVTR